MAGVPKSQLVSLDIRLIGRLPRGKQIVARMKGERQSKELGNRRSCQRPKGVHDLNKVSMSCLPK